MNINSYFRWIDCNNCVCCLTVVCSSVTGLDVRDGLCLWRCHYRVVFSNGVALDWWIWTTAAAGESDWASSDNISRWTHWQQDILGTICWRKIYTHFIITHYHYHALFTRFLGRRSDVVLVIARKSVICNSCAECIYIDLQYKGLILSDSTIEISYKIRTK